MKKVASGGALVGQEKKPKVKRWAPMGDRVLVQMDAPKDTTEGGIALPDQVQEKPNSGTVVAAGEGVGRPATPQGEMAEERLPPFVAGDRVLVMKFAGLEFDPKDKYKMIFKEEDILCKEVED